MERLLWFRVDSWDLLFYGNSLLQLWTCLRSCFNSCHPLLPAFSCTWLPAHVCPLYFINHCCLCTLEAKQNESQLLPWHPVASDQESVRKRGYSCMRILTGRSGQQLSWTFKYYLILRVATWKNTVNNMRILYITVLCSRFGCRCTAALSLHALGVALPFLPVFLTTITNNNTSTSATISHFFVIKGCKKIGFLHTVALLLCIYCNYTFFWW